MTFHSLAFAAFLPAAFIGYWALPHRFRFLFLLAADTVFYMSGGVRQGLVLLAVTAVTYGCALLIERSRGTFGRKLFLSLGVGFPLAALAFFKYSAFALRAAGDLAEALTGAAQGRGGFDFLSKVVVPFGISFYVFKAVAYVADVYLERQQAERHFGYLACFLSYFPDILSGPIDRAGELLPQLRKEKSFRYEDGVYGLRMMLVGWSKKVLLADVLAEYTNLVFGEVERFGGPTLVFASFLFTIQIYCDFSGYSDIALGVSKLFGIDLARNFSTPYFSKSIREFWRRWHISLSTWFRDYVYIPLGGSRVSKVRRMWNMMATFFVSGLWHGANYTYLLWGGLHGFYQIAENALEELARSAGKREGKALAEGEASAGKSGRYSGIRERAHGAFQTVVTFLLVSFAWIFFRADSVGDAFYFVTHLFSNLSVANVLPEMRMSVADLVMISVFVAALAVYDAASLRKDPLREIDRLPAWGRWGLYLGVTLAVASIKAYNGAGQEFIYSKF